ncbi:DNA polymerase III subunit delta [Niabella sp. W65]|nr:DNA polymerase III subunit delta [Niabella sp. W65]MCH7362701.1 DNA polymerase III subunit delta [Niabella sp. W65]
MFSDRQVVIIKEAQQMKDVDKLEPYIQSPLASTILVVAFKDKKLDSRTRFAKVVKDKTEYIITKKLYDNALPEWVNTVVKSMGYTISPKANSLIVDHIGNDLSRIKNEIDKILINLGSRQSITEEDVENYVGISKEFNVFELQNAIATRNLAKAIRIIQYFAANPKIAPIQLVLPSLYSFLIKPIWFMALQAEKMLLPNK